MLAFMIMAYSTDLRKRVLDFIDNGGSKAAAKRIFGVSRRTIYNWLEAEDPLASEKPDPKDPELLIMTHFSNMSPSSQTRHSLNVPNTSVFQQTVSFMLSRSSISREKKDDDLQRTVPDKTSRVSLGTSTRDTRAWQNTGLS